MLEQTAKLDPQNAFLQARLAEIYAYCGEGEKSKSRMLASLALSPRDDTVLMICADAYAALGDRGQAIKLANEAVANGFTSDQLDQDPEAWRFRNDPKFTSPKT